MHDAAVRHFPIGGAVVALWFVVSAGADAGDLRLQPLMENVYAVLQPWDQRYNDANSLIVIGDDAVAVVDAQARPAGVAQVIAFVRQLTQLPVRYVINTHWHADHTQGNAAWRARFGETVQFVGHDSLFDDVPRRAAKDLRERVAAVKANVASAQREIVLGNDENGAALDPAGLARQRAGIERALKWLQANEDARFLLPDVTYHKRLRLSLGGIDLELLHFKAHT
ncbi:MAG: MBL fold metallo-hydrolase, partial [Gammaproteobacteria bacterium]|nr:MBL fold metallo-hydrolase [Gammaproteobacteria bacterium]